MFSMKRIDLPENVTYIIDTLQAAGFEAYAVGGCVRDTLLSRVPGDWDITTNAQPADTKRLFRYTVDTGIEHGTVTVLCYDEKNRSAPPETFEVTTYRIDGAYSDGRHPDSVTYTGELREDLRRRDFTINAMAYNSESGLVDLFSGQEDLENKTVRCVGDPDERFNEDALRILRAVRFAAQLGFSIEKNTEDAVKRHAKRLSAVSKERIFTELNKLLCSAHIDKLEKISELGLSPYIAPGFENVKPVPSGLSLPAVPLEKKYLRYALIMRGMDKNTAKNILTALKADTKTRDNASLLCSEAYTKLPCDRYLLKKYMSKMSPAQFEDLLYLKELLNEEGISEIKTLYNDFSSKNEPVYMKDLVVTGADLLNAGVPEGKEVGRILNAMLDDVRKDPIHNSVLYLFSQHCRTAKE